MHSKAIELIESTTLATSLTVTVKLGGLFFVLHLTVSRHSMCRYWSSLASFCVWAELWGDILSIFDWIYLVTLCQFSYFDTMVLREESGKGQFVVRHNKKNNSDDDGGVGVEGLAIRWRQRKRDDNAWGWIAYLHIDCRYYYRGDVYFSDRQSTTTNNTTTARRSIFEFGSVPTNDQSNIITITYSNV